MSRDLTFNSRRPDDSPESSASPDPFADTNQAPTPPPHGYDQPPHVEYDPHNPIESATPDSYSSQDENLHFQPYQAQYPSVPELSQSEAGTRLLADHEYLRQSSVSPSLAVPASDYDRYPSMSQSGSRVVSSTSLASQWRNYNENNSGSEDGNPFISNTDFSPFGGYPASQFPLHIDDKEDDDYLHNPDPVADADYDKNRFLYDLKSADKRVWGGIVGLIAMTIIAVGVFALIPAFTYTGVGHNKAAPEVYEVLTHYKYPQLSAIRYSLVDPDTPESALTKKAKDGSDWDLVFSDEFNAEGRTFYDGDDQFWTAPDLHYDATKDLEWYDPDAVTTANGTATLRMDAFKNHNMFYRSGMLQSWNKMCYSEGRLEISARLPFYGNITGLWPGLWTMGNLGRPGYLATTDGVWPYSYEACDAGITANQSSPDGISFLPGQRLNSCTCKGESHPNPGTGRGAPEIDAIEGEVGGGLGIASQSLQLAPFDIWYMPDYDFMEIHNASVTMMNTYTGGPFQQALSAVTMLNTSWYEFGDNIEHNFQSYGFEYLNDNTDGYLRWFVGQDPTLTVHANALHPNGNIDWRRLSKEPMSIIMNMGISNNWAYIDWNALKFPFQMRVDFVRIYQPKGKTNLGCDPQGYPTQEYINSHKNIYYNVNLTSFEGGGYSFPKNELTGC